jgi:hypothetical protein
VLLGRRALGLPRGNPDGLENALRDPRAQNFHSIRERPSGMGEDADALHIR